MENKPKFRPNPKLRLMDQVREVLRYHHYSRQPPVVLTKSGIHRLFLEISGLHLLMARLLYGAGLRLMECIRLRICDLDFERAALYVRAAKGGKDRTTILPKPLHPALEAKVKKVRDLHEKDLRET